MSKSILSTSNRNLKTSQNELTLPPIIEAQVTKNVSFSKPNHNNNRHDSGIVLIDEHLASNKTTNGWKLSPYNSEHEYDVINRHTHNKENNDDIVTVELVDVPLKKNPTSSTLNSYGKSSSVQSKMTKTTNQSFKMNQFIASTQENSSNLFRLNEQHSVMESEANYLEVMGRLNSSSFKDVSHLSNSAHLNSQINKEYHSKSFYNNQQSNNNRSRTISSKSYKALNEKGMMSDQDKISNLKSSLNKQNSFISNDLLTERRTSYNSTKSIYQSLNTQRDKPPTKPRQHENQTKNGLERQNTFADKQSYFAKLNQANEKKLKAGSSLRPTTSFNQKVLKENSQEDQMSTNNQNSTLVFNNESELLTSRNNLVPISRNNINTENQNEAKRTNNTITDETNPVIKLASASKALTLEDIYNISNETGLSNFTTMRILKWLEEIEKCGNMIKPPSQLTWSNRSINSARNRQNVNNNDYNLSDYDDVDEQIIEYNRIVDKTFHIVHKDD